MPACLICYTEGQLRMGQLEELMQHNCLLCSFIYTVNQVMTKVCLACWSCFADCEACC